ncbi:hypothetical protein SBOR_4347 [Sclerotinia borealis F-4128]|uniref:Hydrophobic surface binding protein A n=1 Tax=Sclerotinia borealis (strain F-4128) TaxID=1432307 RepID=W9CL44_SCLBF|nr:hypothetical protein SBOR_4347 [Sclerotinia borealis F-4128]
MVAIKNIILFISAVSAAVISKRTPETILADIATVDTNLKALTTAVDNYNGGFFQLLAVNSAESTLDTSIKNAATDASNTSQLSSDDSSNILAAVNKLIPDIQTALDALVGKMSTFDSEGLKSTVAGDLAALKKDTDTFGKAVNAISSSDVKSDFVVAVSKIDTAFTTAEAQF